jgi:peptide subunit release factor 1 (eRF1)
MITREDIRQLAGFEVDGEQQYALSFFFQPQKPQNKSHREEAILAKDLVRDALQEVEKNRRKNGVRADLNRILELVGRLHGNQARAKAVFACGGRNFWREFDLPPQLPATSLFVNRRFHLKPLAVVAGAQPRLLVAVVDRHRARIFELAVDELQERESLFRPLPHRGRGDGFAGYDAGHSERSVNDEVLHHFKNVGEHLKRAMERGRFEKLIIGCQDSNWPEFESHLHPYLKQRLLGQFPAEVANITGGQVRIRASRIMEDWLDRRRHDLVKEVLSQSRSNARGVTGLRRVLRSLELGEVQTLLVGESFAARAVECSGCGHLDAHVVRFCPVCGRRAQELQDVSDVLIAAAIRRDVELFYLKNLPDLDRVGNIAALLRFRADQMR